ncbi:hypothetical protein ACWGST_04925 [Agromyces sp. NPDC055520]
MNDGWNGLVEADAELHDEATVVVVRPAGSAAASRDVTVDDVPVDGVPADDATVVVAERTTVREGSGVPVENSDRAAADDDADATVVVGRGPAADAEATRAVQRGGRRGQGETRVTHRSAPVMNTPRRRDRRRPAPAPVSDEVLRSAEVGAGPGLLDRYEVRELAASRVSEPPALDPGPAPTRDLAASLPSVERRSRRGAIVSIAAVGAACLIAVAGLAAIAVAVFGGLFA